MFTGLIEDLGTLQNIKKGAHSAKLTINTSMNLSEVRIGDSIAVNGVCLTVVDLTNNTFTVEVMKETLEKTNLRELTNGQHLNLERALKFGSRLDGHLVTGHVDGIGTIQSKERHEIAEVIYFNTEPSILKYLIKKGSIAIDGISLTIVEVGNDFFSISLIPHTREKTTLGIKDIGDTVNLEVDMFAKYVEKFLSNINNSNSSLTYEKLAEYGYI